MVCLRDRPCLSFTAAGTGPGLCSFRNAGGFVSHSPVAPGMPQRVNLLLLGQHGAAGGTPAAIGQSGLGAGGCFAGNRLRSMSFGRDLTLRGQNLAAHRTLAAFGQSRLGTGSCLAGKCLRGMLPGGRNILPPLLVTAAGALQAFIAGFRTGRLLFNCLIIVPFRNLLYGPFSAHSTYPLYIPVFSAGGRLFLLHYPLMGMSVRVFCRSCSCRQAKGQQTENDYYQPFLHGSLLLYRVVWKVVSR